MNKDVKKILIVLGLVALSDGFFYNFQELWLSGNNLSLKTISIVLCLCSFIGVSVIFISSSLVKQSKMKKFVSILLLLKCIIEVLLYFLNGTGYLMPIKFFTMIDFAIDIEILTCIYPLITLIVKDDKLYAKKDLIYNGVWYFAVFLVGLLLGKKIGIFSITYNSYNLLSSIMLLLAYLVFININVNKYITNIDKELISYSSLFKLLKKDKITKNYFLFSFFGITSYYSLMIMLISLLTNILNYSDVWSSYFKLITGLIAVLIGILSLRLFCFKNNNINFFIKYVMRIILYISTIIINKPILLLIAIIYTRLTSLAYVQITEAPYINRIDNKYQLTFCSLNYMISYFSRSIGALICGLVFIFGTRTLLIVCTVLSTLSIIFLIKANKLREKEEKNN